MEKICREREKKMQEIQNITILLHVNRFLLENNVTTFVLTFVQDGNDSYSCNWECVFIISLIFQKTFILDGTLSCRIPFWISDQNNFDKILNICCGKHLYSCFLLKIDFYIKVSCKRKCLHEDPYLEHPVYTPYRIIGFLHKRSLYKWSCLYSSCFRWMPLVGTQNRSEYESHKLILKVPAKFQRIHILSVFASDIAANMPCKRFVIVLASCFVYRVQANLSSLNNLWQMVVALEYKILQCIYTNHSE